MGKQSKTHKLGEDGFIKRNAKKLGSAVWYKALPAIFKGIIVAGFFYALVDNLARFNQLPESVQGGTAVVVFAAVVKVASLKQGK